uniref:Ig-like domain-containing protein n=1 Tax=Haplochromis burtoni TaxID=8153 RepID=A0A3Q2V384_HAPBU
TMTPAKFVFCLTCLLLGEMAQVNNQEFFSSGRQERRFISVRTGDSVILHCSSKNGVTPRFYWYKQTLAEKPRLISTFYVYEQNATFHSEFKSDPRFTLDTQTGQNNLIISDVRISDSATYYCICSYLHTSTFSESITVGVKDSDLNIKAVVQQSASETIQPGSSVTLNCTVHTGTCDGEHSIYWFKDSEESHPRLIYTHGGRNDQCERKPNRRTHTCVSNLTMESLNVSHAGIYYCAVASCGHILFGGGTTLLDFGDSPAPMYFLNTALTLTTIISVLSTFLVEKKTVPIVYLKNSGSSPGQLHHDADNVHYTALSVNLPNSSTRQRNNQDECLYSSVKQQVIFFPIQRKKKFTHSLDVDIQIVYTIIFTAFFIV